MLCSVPEPPELVATLLTENSSRCCQFRRDFRKYNCALCLASLQANEITFSSAPFVDKVQGDVYRFIEPLRPANGQQPKCLQMFFVYAAIQADIYSRRFDALDLIIVKDLSTMLESCNSYYVQSLTVEPQSRYCGLYLYELDMKKIMRSVVGVNAKFELYYL